MIRSHSAWLVVPGLLALAACGGPPPHTTQVIVQPPPQVQVAPEVAPMPPPPSHAELVPPPSQGVGPTVWQPGHWDYTAVPGNPWAWVGGQYVPPPAGSTTWVPGQLGATAQRWLGLVGRPLGISEISPAWRLRTSPAWRERSRRISGEGEGDREARSSPKTTRAARPASRSAPRATDRCTPAAGAGLLSSPSARPRY